VLVAGLGYRLDGRSGRGVSHDWRFLLAGSTGDEDVAASGLPRPRFKAGGLEFVPVRLTTQQITDPNSIYFAGLIRPLPRRCLQAGGKIFRLGLSGCGTVRKPVPLRAGQLTSVDTVIDFIMAIIAQK
jgi:hypothetical protein